MQFYYIENGKRNGPVHFDELIQLLKTGKIHRHTLIWCEKYDDWKKVSESGIDISFLPPTIESVVIHNENVIQQNISNPFMHYINAFRRYADFEGRARRKEFWFFMLFHILIFILMMVFDDAIGTDLIDKIDEDMAEWIPIPVFGIFSTIYYLVSLLPSLAITARRLHDTGKTGWLQTLEYIPLINLVACIILIIFYCQDSQYGENRYGFNPKGFDNHA